MTEAVLLKLIMCLCGNMKPVDTAKLCMETYVNCAIVEDGRFLTIKEFDKKCNYMKNQDNCYK